jgi:hypothetical protein
MRSPSSLLLEVSVNPIFLPNVLERNPRIECGSQSVALISSVSKCLGPVGVRVAGDPGFPMSLGPLFQIAEPGRSASDSDQIRNDLFAFPRSLTDDPEIRVGTPPAKQCSFFSCR